MDTTRTEPTVNDLSAVLKEGVEKEPMLLLDTTGSMSFPQAQNSPVQRRDVIHEAIRTVVAKLAAEDSQAEAEKAAGTKDMTGEQAGGVMTVTFANGDAKNLGDLSPENLTEKWNSIKWGGGTIIMPGWNLLKETYMEEFGDEPIEQRPNLLAVVITDGEADDTAEFAKALSQNKGGTYTCVAILGFGPEHDKALKTYQEVAAGNNHVRVVTFGSETDPNTIANGLLSLIGG